MQEFSSFEHLSIRDFRGILCRRSFTIVAVVGLITCLAVGYTVLRGPAYTATALILVELGPGIQRSIVPSIVDTQRDIIRSPALIESTMEDLQLYELDEYNPGVDRISALIMGILGWAHSLGILSSGDPSAAADLDPDAPSKEAEALAHDQAEIMFAQNLSVTHSGESLILNVNFSSRDAECAAKVANHLAGLYLEHQIGQRLEEVKQAEVWLAGRVEQSRAQLLDTERKLADLRNRYQFKLDEVAVRSESGVRYRELEREAEAKKATYSRVLSQYYDVQNDPGSPTPTGHILSLAATPTEPSSLPVGTVAAVSFIASFMLGCCLAFARDLTDRRLHDPDQVVTALGVPSLGALPRPDSLWPASTRLGSRAASARLSYLRALQSLSLRIAAVGPAPQAFLVTSLVSDKRRAPIAADLAIALRQTTADRVLLVDFDLGEPRIAARLGLPGDVAGVADLLGGGGAPPGSDSARGPSELIVHHAESGIDVLSAGRGEVTQPMLSCSAVRRLLQAARASCDVMIIQGPPLLCAADAQLIAVCANSTILVVPSGRTRLRDLEAGLGVLRDVNAPVLGVVLSDVARRRAPSPRAAGPIAVASRHGRAGPL